jgi:hypothetical protein
MAEITFETLRAAIETTRGTAIASPTHLLNLEGTYTPRIVHYKPREQRGTRARNYRDVVVRKFGELEGEGDADVNELPFYLQQLVEPNTSPSTPTDAVATRLWEFIGNLTADDIKSSTFWFGDPALNQLKADFLMLTEMEFENDASGEEVATISVKGMGGFPTKVAAPGATASIAGATLPGQLMSCFVDTSSAIGTTEISGRVISAKHTIRTGAAFKYVAGGPAAALDFSLIGREKIVALTTELKLELIDYTQYDLWAAATSLKVRVRHNGSLIETQNATDFYNYVEFDTYGPFEELEWDDHEGTNRALTLVMNGHVDSTLGSDIRVAVQNARTSL